MIPISKETIRAFSGRIIGFLETDKEGNQQARAFSGKIIAFYDKSCNCTRLFSGKIISHGNTCVGQLYNKSANPEYRE